MYGLWLYKELKTEYGHCKVEVFRKGYTASAVEIGGFVGNSLNLALENLDTITAPIGKSVCSFSIYDTDQVEYDDLFTPDATAYKVVVSTKVDGGAYVTRWSGYITPDFFAENLSYRTPISISARDNIGYLNDVDFDLTATTVTIRQLITSAFAKIAEDYPMSLVFETTKQTAEGILAIDATISTVLLQEKSWYEVLETILHDLGMQMRWVDNNTIAVFDVSQLSEKFSMQRFNFIENSGYREILPAWRELSQKQDYGLRENFFEGWLKSNALTYVKSQSVKLPIPIGQAGTGSSATMKYYAPNNWGVAGNTYTINPEDFAYLGAYGQASTPFGKRIYFTGVDKADTTIAQNYMSWRQDVNKSNEEMQISFKAFNSLLGTSYNFPDTLLAYNPAERFLGINLGLTTGDYIQLGLKVNIFLHVGTKTYIMRNTWEEISGAETSSLYFILDKVGDISEADNTPKEQEITIKIGNMPAKGQLELRIYGFTLEDKKNLQEDAKLATYDWLRMVSYIDDVTYSYANDNKSTGVMSGVEIASLHNIKASEDYSFGQVTMFSGGINAYAGGLYNANGDELVGFKRNADGTTYPLLELVGREIIHFNKRNYTKLSGTVKNLSSEPLGFNKLLVYNGKNYLPFACSLDVISNTMNVTTMQEVEPYITHSFVEIKSELVTGGGATVSGGNNTALQYSAEVSNAKRISELNNASESEKKESYIIVDNASWNESKKVPLSEMEGLNEAELTEFLTANEYATQPWVSGIAKGLADDIANRVLIADFEKLEYAVDGIAGYFTNGSANNALKLGGQLPSYYATADSLNIVKNDVTAVSNRVKTFEDVIGIDANGDVYIKGTRNFYTEGGTIAMGDLGEAGSGGGGAAGIVTVRVNGYDYNSVNGIVTLPDLLPKSGGTISSTSWLPLVVNSTYSDGSVAIKLASNDVKKGGLVYNENGIQLYNDTSGSYLNITNAGVVTFNGYNLYHTGNFNPANYLPLSGGIVSNSSRDVLTLNSTDSYGPMLNLCVNGTKVSAIGHIPSASESIYGMFISNVDSNIGLLLGSDRKVYVVEDVERLSNKHTIIHSGNYTDYALSKNGGTIYGSLMISNASGAIILDNNSNGNYGYLTYQGGVNWRVTDSGWGASYAILHEGNYSSYALPLNGGEIVNSSVDTPLFIKGSGASYIGFYNGSSVAGYIGFGADGLARTYLQGASNILIHSGNYSSYALPLSGGTINSDSYVPLILNANSNQSRMQFQTQGVDKALIGWSSSEGAWLYSYPSGCYLHIKDDGTPCYNGNPLIHSGNIGSYNAGSATKLQTARSIWGQSFDGSANVSGNLSMLWQKIYWNEDINNYYIGWNGSQYCFDYVNYYGHRFHAGGSERMRITTGGNVLMGTTSDNGAKLQVNGGATFGGDVYSEGTMAMARLTSSSDAKLKNNIAEVSAEQSMGIIRQLRPTTWNWKKDGKKSYGLIAQEVEPIIPEMVCDINDTLRLEYNQLHAFEIGAIQHIDSEVEQLKRDLKTANNRIEQLESKLKQYELWQ